MKKYTPYIIGFIALAALVVLLFTTVKKPRRIMDERVTLKQRDKIPYGFFAAKALLPALFPNATIHADKRSPGYWDSLSTTGSRQAVFLTALRFNADHEELEELLMFARNGNYVFIIARNLSYQAGNFFDINNSNISIDGGLFGENRDTLEIKLTEPRFADTKTYLYPGRKFANYIKSVDTTKAIILGRNASGYPNFLQFNTGDGAIFLHTAPLAFSNYFILHKDNIHYFQNAVSVIPADVDKVLWNEYYLSKTEEKEKEPNWLSVLFRYDSFRWALLTAIATLLIFVLIEMRRKQRVIPALQKPNNDSLDFVQTIGRLYYDRKDHQDLAKKMAVYFLDHVRSRYKISTNELDNSFVNALHFKSGHPVQEIDKITAFISFIDDTRVVNENQLAQFHSQLESFYQNT